MFGFDDTVLPAGFDLRGHIFGAGLPAEFYDPQAPGNVAASFGAESTAPPPLPNLRDPGALRAWAAELWRRTGIHYGSANDREAQHAWLRLQRIPVAVTPQAMLADIISAGPGTKIKGADSFYRNIRVVQQKVKALTGEPTISATAGAMAAAIALAVAATTKHAADVAKAAVAAPGNVATEGRKAVETVVKEAGAAQARAVEAAKEIAAIPGDTVRAGVDAVTGVPKHLATEAAELGKTIATEVLATVRSALPGAQQLAQNLNPMAHLANASTGITLGVFGVGALVVAGLAAVYAGPTLAAAYTAKSVAGRR